MRALSCQCGQAVFYDNTRCRNCERLLGFRALAGTMVSLDPQAGGQYRGSDGSDYRLCENREDHDVCNGVVRVQEGSPAARYCFCCGLNRTIPDLSRERNLQRWRKLEQAKRRLVSGLSDLGLAIIPPPQTGWPALHFDFLEDQRSHPGAPENFVATGHRNGLITINILEADEVERANQKEISSERYRTLLGHFRHEAGHYYYFQLVENIEEFSGLFGDPGQDYVQCMRHYYEQGPAADWQEHYISAYASSHPLEDWAESFAHYLHMQDMLQTALAQGLIAPDETSGLSGRMADWTSLSVTLNELSQSLGLGDAYPFVITQGTRAKFEFIDMTLNRYREQALSVFN